MNTVTKKIIVITGAAQGIGNRIAKSLIEKRPEYTYYLCDVKTEELEKKFHNEKQQGHHRLITLDVTDSKSIQDLVNEITQEKSKVWAVISNAGISTKLCPVTELDEARFQQIMAVNCFASVYLAKYFTPLLIENGGGRFIITGSSSAILQSGFKTGYEMSKAAVRAFANGYRVEVEPYGVKVCLMEPGGIQTDLLTTIFPATSKAKDTRNFWDYAINYSTNYVNSYKKYMLEPESLVDYYHQFLFDQDPPRQVFKAVPAEEEMFHSLTALPGIIDRDKKIREVFYDWNCTNKMNE